MNTIHLGAKLRKINDLRHYPHTHHDLVAGGWQTIDGSIAYNP
jgi:hypothetical protein